MHLSFSGAGFMGIYHIGVAKTLIREGNGFFDKVEKIGGSSSGSLMAGMLAVFGADLEMIKHCEEFCVAMGEEVKQKNLGVFSKQVDLTARIKHFFEQMFPPDAHIKASGRLFLSITNENSHKNEISTHYETRDHLIKFLLASSCIPKVTTFKPIEIDGQTYIDGGLTNNMPKYPEGETICVSPFEGNHEISPSISDKISLGEEEEEEEDEEMKELEWEEDDGKIWGEKEKGEEFWKRKDEEEKEKIEKVDRLGKEAEREDKKKSILKKLEKFSGEEKNEEEFKEAEGPGKEVEKKEKRKSIWKKLFSAPVVVINNQSIKINTDNLMRSLHILRPPTGKRLIKYYKQGCKDARRFLFSKGYIKEKDCLEKIDELGSISMSTGSRAMTIGSTGNSPSMSGIGSTGNMSIKSEIGSTGNENDEIDLGMVGISKKLSREYVKANILYDSNEKYFFNFNKTEIDKKSGNFKKDFDKYKEKKEKKINKENKSLMNNKNNDVKEEKRKEGEGKGEESNKSGKGKGEEPNKGMEEILKIIDSHSFLNLKVDNSKYNNKNNKK